MGAGALRTSSECRMQSSEFRVKTMTYGNPAVNPTRLMLVLLLTVVGCAGQTRTLTTEPIKWVDADKRTIPEPAEIVENQIWDIADHTFFYQMGKLLDLSWSVHRLGTLVGAADHLQADNVNALDEAVASSWWQHRHYYRPMTREEIKVGPGSAAPDSSGAWQVVAGKFEGGTAGFTIRDVSGGMYLLKFDSEGNNEMGSAAEVIATKALYAAGYNVPQNMIVYFDPKLLEISPKAKVPDGKGGKRPMERRDLESILDNIIPQADGRLRCVASKFLSGAPVGIFEYHGLRKDDPNDRVRHQHRRELRGLRVIGSWMNDADRRAANTLDMYETDAAGRKYVRHYIIDMGSAFGSNNLMPHLPKYGNEYVWDPGSIAKSLVSLGFYRKGWEEPLPMPHPEVGYFENQTFNAISWVPTYPNPAFERCTGRDGYWGAKLLMGFSDDDILALVETGEYANPGATQELTRLLIERRDMIGRYWYGRVNPLDRFRIDRERLHFTDLAIEGKLAQASGTSYQYRMLDGGGETDGAPGRLAAGGSVPIDVSLKAEAYHGVELTTSRRDGPQTDQPVRVFFYKYADGRNQIVRVERED